MSVLFPSAGHTPDELAAAARRLADDLAFLAAGAEPDPAALADAPVLDRWSPGIRRAGCLVGLVSGHPRLRDGHLTATTDLFAINSDGMWARTWSRYYRLGRTAGDDGRRQ